LYKQPDGPLAAGPRTDFGSLSDPEKRMLKRLWALEAEKPPPGKRIGLVISPDSPGLESFNDARDSLLSKGWVGIGAQKGLVFLTSPGRRFCEAHQDEITLFPIAPLGVTKE